MKRKSPNIPIFMSDNQPAELLGCYGNDEIHTPHLDGLAEAGIRFDNAFCVNAMCSPSRASVLTGLMPSQHGIHTWLDDGVGRILEALRRNDLSGDTLVVYTADHGYSLGRNGFWGHGRSTWPSNTHRAAFNIPLLVARHGQIAPSQVRGELTSQLDLFATLLDYIGLDAKNLNGRSDSRSFAPLLNGRSHTWRDAVFMEQEETRAIRTARWLYMMRFKGGAEHPLKDEMYDLAKDPAERNDLVGDPAYAAIAAELSQRIASFFDAHSDPRYDLWKGGTAKSNSDAPWLWKEAWGPQWEPNFDGNRA